MENQKKSMITIYRVVLIAVFAALTFVASKLSVPIPVAVGNMSRIHLGNIFCLLSGFVLGPVGGGLAAGIGSALYDVMDPVHIASAPFTFLFKFLLAAVCGWIAYRGGRKGADHRWNLIGAVSGSVVYMVLYLAKSFIQSLLLGNEMEVVLIALGTKALTSAVNAVIAVVVSVPLYAAIRLALKKSGMLEKLG